MCIIICSPYFFLFSFFSDSTSITQILSLSYNSTRGIQYKFLFQSRLLQNMQQQQLITHLSGVDVSDYKVRKVGREELISANFEQYSENHLHMVIHAIQFGQKVPSVKSMERTEKRNKAKITGKDDVVQARVKIRALRPGGKKSRKRMPNYVNTISSSVHAPTAAKKVNKKSTFKVQSPQQIVLKAARQACRASVEDLIKKKDQQSQSQSQSESSSSVPVAVKREFPIYFQKKHKSHKRRIKERWQLIKENRDKLVQIYGGEILDRESRIGIKDIRVALGLDQPQRMDVQAVGEFMEMVDEDSSSSSSSSSSSHK